MGLNLLEQLKESPIGKQLESDFAKQTLAKRLSAVNEIQKINAELTKALPGLVQAREKAEGAVKVAEEVLEKARNAHGRAYGHEHNTRVRADARRHQQEQILRGCYPEEIDKFKDEMDKLLRLTRSKGIENRDHGHTYGGQRHPKVYSDSEAVHSRLKYIRDAIRETEELKLEALSPEKLTARLEEVRRKMPQTGVMKLVT